MDQGFGQVQWTISPSQVHHFKFGTGSGQQLRAAQGTLYQDARE
jgi:hypothetical protein